MTALEALLEELKKGKSRPAYFEAIRQIKDSLIDNYPLDRTMYEDHTDCMEAITKFEQSYNRVAFVKGEDGH